MAWRIEFARSAEKDLRRLTSRDADRIVSYLHERVASAENPREVGLAMQGSLFHGFTRYRVGDHRIIAHVEDATVTIFVVRIGHRREVYR